MLPIRHAPEPYAFHFCLKTNISVVNTIKTMSPKQNDSIESYHISYIELLAQIYTI